MKKLDGIDAKIRYNGRKVLSIFGLINYERTPNNVRIISISHNKLLNPPYQSGDRTSLSNIIETTYRIGHSLDNSKLEIKIAKIGVD